SQSSIRPLPPAGVRPHPLSTQGSTIILQKPEPETGKLATAWYLDRVDLENGTVHYEDRANRSSYTLKKIQLSGRRFRPKAAFPLNVSMDYAGQGLQGSVGLGGTLDLGGMDPAKMSARWDPLTLRHLGLLVESSGEAQNFSAPAVSAK